MFILVVKFFQLDPVVPIAEFNSSTKVYHCRYLEDDVYTEDLTIKDLRKYELFTSEAAAVEKTKKKRDLLMQRTLNWETKDKKRISVAVKKFKPVRMV